MVKKYMNITKAHKFTFLNRASGGGKTQQVLKYTWQYDIVDGNQVSL